MLLPLLGGREPTVYAAPRATLSPSLGAAMSAGPVAESAHSDGRSLAERAAAILRDEIANGALASIGLADKRWSAVRHDLGRATSSSIDRDALIRTVLDLIA